MEDETQVATAIRIIPNPAENSVVFEYTFEAPGGVLLQIYGSDGRKAAVPVDSQ